MEFSLQQSIAVLSRMPKILDALLSALPGDWAMSNDGLGTWSPYDILGHLVHGEKTDWIPRVRMIMEHGTSRTFDPFDRLAQFRESEGKSLESLLSEFASLRRENLKQLEAMRLTPNDLVKQGVHPEFGNVTLQQLLATWVVHDLRHAAHIAEVASRQYRSAVGPWKAYLPILGA